MSSPRIGWTTKYAPVLKDECGKRYGKLYVLYRASKEAQKAAGSTTAIWHARCVCGVEILVRGENLRTGKQTQCNECAAKQRGKSRRKRPKPLYGQRFGMLTVLSRVDAKPRDKWLCRCDCGAESLVSEKNLERGVTTRCRGCGTKAAVTSRAKYYVGTFTAAEFASAAGVSKASVVSAIKQGRGPALMALLEGGT